MTSTSDESPTSGVGRDAARDVTDVTRRHGHHRHHARAQLAIIATVAVGGVVGAIVRYWMSMSFPSTTGHFPWITFIINVSGSAILGFLLILLMEQFPRGRLTRPLIGSGFCGAYTTFSTYVVEGVLLVRGHHVATAASYVLGSLFAGLLAVWMGMTLARLVVRAEQWLQREAP